MMTLFIGEGGLPMIVLAKVSGVHSIGGDLFAIVDGNEVNVEACRDAFMQAFMDFHAGPAVEPAKPAVDPHKIGKLDRMPTVEEVKAHNGKWRWHSGWHQEDVSVNLHVYTNNKVKIATPNRRPRLLKLRWIPCDTIEPIAEAP